MDMPHRSDFDDEEENEDDQPSPVSPPDETLAVKAVGTALAIPIIILNTILILGPMAAIGFVIYLVVTGG